MFVAQTFFEVRFASPSLAFISRGMELGVALSQKYETFQTNAVGIVFNTGEKGSSLAFDPHRIGLQLSLHDSSLTNCQSTSTMAVRAWNEHIKLAPKVQRTGLRLRTAFPANMPKAELIDAYSAWAFSPHFLERQEGAYDFAIVLENIVGEAGDRAVIGVMGHDELIQKWDLDAARVDEAASYLTTDIDYWDQVEFQSGVIEGFIRDAWSKIRKRNDELSTVIGVGV